MTDLRKYYRKPNAFVTLPSKGALYRLADDEVSMMDEIGVLRMTMMNQLSTNNPESLINGHAVEELIRDCTTIKHVNPRNMFKCDVDALIMGIRMVSVNDELSIELPCPKCEAKETYGVSLSAMLADMTHHDELPYSFPLPTMGEIVLNLIPSTLESSLRVDQTFFTDAKEIDHIRRNIKSSTTKQDITEDEIEQLQTEMKRHVDRIHEIQRNMTVNTIRLYTDCIESVTTPEGVVENPEEIFDLVMSLVKEDIDGLKDKITEINSVGIPKTKQFVCPSCEHEYTAPVEVNPTDFFGNGSR